jgi:hypothetical protein
MARGAAGSCGLRPAPHSKTVATPRTPRRSPDRSPVSARHLRRDSPFRPHGVFGGGATRHHGPHRRLDRQESAARHRLAAPRRTLAGVCLRRRTRFPVWRDSRVGRFAGGRRRRSATGTATAAGEGGVGNKEPPPVAPQRVRRNRCRGVRASWVLPWRERLPRLLARHADDCDRQSVRRQGQYYLRGHVEHRPSVADRPDRARVQHSPRRINDGCSCE